MNALLARWTTLAPELRAQAVLQARSGVPVPSIDDRAAWAGIGHDIADRAAAERGSPWPQPLLSAYARYWRGGKRTRYKDPAARLRHRTAMAVLAAAITADDADLDEAADGLELLCRQSTWCLAAHERFAAVCGHVVPDVDAPYLDLGAAETVGLL